MIEIDPVTRGIHVAATMDGELLRVETHIEHGSGIWIIFDIII